MEIADEIDEDVKRIIIKRNKCRGSNQPPPRPSYSPIPRPPMDLPTDMEEYERLMQYLSMKNRLPIKQDVYTHIFTSIPILALVATDIYSGTSLITPQQQPSAT